jgi:hypothetical protein
MEIITNITTILSLVGVGTLVGIIIKYFLDIKKEKRLQNQKIKEDKYRSTVVYMRSYLNPEHVTRGFYHFSDPSISNLSGENLKLRLLENIKENYFEILLYASDDVILSIKDFIKDPSKKNWLQTIISMRKDLWSDAKLRLKDIEI